MTNNDRKPSVIKVDKLIIVTFTIYVQRSIEFLIFVQHVTPDTTDEVPWTLFLSSDRRMARNLTREVVSQRARDRIVTSPSVEESWSKYLSLKCSNFVELCSHYPIATFIGSNRQMVRRVTAQAAGRRKK